jgi:hypothetical protein
MVLLRFHHGHPCNRILVLTFEDARDNLIKDIFTAFAGVTREGGVSWRGALIADFYGDESFADYVDEDSCWQDLILSRTWIPDSGLGGYSFLDAIGFRYYLAPCMVRNLLEPFIDEIVNHLTLRDDDFREWRLEKWSLFTPDQAACIARFLQAMEIASLTDEYPSAGAEWSLALNSYWIRFIPYGSNPSLKILET